MNESYRRPTPNVINGPYVTDQKLGSARASGPLVGLWGGSLNLTALLERRTEVAKSSASFTSAPAPIGDSGFYTPRRSQSVSSAYAELFAPIVSDINAKMFLHEAMQWIM
jgi:hypothetical protein